MIGVVLYYIHIHVLVVDSVFQSGRRILDGRDAVPGEFPFVVRIELHTDLIDGGKIVAHKEAHHCTGAAISPTWTITAQHCLFEKVDEKNSTFEMKHVIKYGDPDKKPSENKKIATILRYEFNAGYKKWKIDTLNTDIGLVKSEPILLNTFARISSMDFTALYGREVTLVGYGMMLDKFTKKLKRDTLDFNKPLQVLERALLIKCNIFSRKFALRNMKYPQICAATVCNNRKQTTLGGDSGGPVVHESGIVGVICGMTSLYNLQFQEGMTNILAPNYMYLTAVSPYLDWIHSVVNSESSDALKML